ncbi:MAG: phosphopantetheine-binding protein [Ectothiorhodospiraceae bacterium]|jgi:acyl carrier protein
MAGDGLRDTVLAVLGEVAPEVDTEALEPRASFRDQTEMDSVDFLNFVLKLEQRLGTKIPEYDYPKLSSLQGCLDYLGETA